MTTTGLCIILLNAKTTPVSDGINLTNKENDLSQTRVDLSVCCNSPTQYSVLTITICHSSFDMSLHLASVINFKPIQS